MTKHTQRLNASTLTCWAVIYLHLSSNTSGTPTPDSDMACLFHRAPYPAAMAANQRRVLGKQLPNNAKHAVLDFCRATLAAIHHILHAHAFPQPLSLDLHRRPEYSSLTTGFLHTMTSTCQTAHKLCPESIQPTQPYMSLRRVPSLTPPAST